MGVSMSLQSQANTSVYDMVSMNMYDLQKEARVENATIRSRCEVKHTIKFMTSIPPFCAEEDGTWDDNGSSDCLSSDHFDGEMEPFHFRFLTVHSSMGSVKPLYKIDVPEQFYASVYIPPQVA